MKIVPTLAFLLAFATAVVAEPPKAVDPESIKEKVSIKLGKELTIEFKRDGDRLQKPSVSKDVKADKATITVKLDVTDSSPVRPPREGATRPYLHIDNQFDKTLHYRALVRLKGGKEFFPIVEDLEPVPSGGGGNKCWGWEDKIEEVLLYDFKLEDKISK